MPKTKSQPILRYGLIALIVFAVGAMGFRLYQIQKEKRDFAKAEASIDALAQQIEATIGQPDETKKEKSCGRANLKSEEGPLTCSVGYSLLYKNRGVDGANQLMEKIAQQHASKVRIGSGSARGLGFVTKNEARGTQIFYQDLEVLSGLSCVLGYKYPSDLDQITGEDGEDFLATISCSSKAIKQLYPLRD